MLKNPPMKTKGRILIAAGVCLFVGCAWEDGFLVARGRSPSIDTEYANLAKLYLAGKINAQQLTERQHVLAYRQERAAANARASLKSAQDSAFSSGDMPNRAEELAQEKEAEERWNNEMQKRQAIGKELDKLYPSQPVPRR